VASAHKTPEHVLAILRKYEADLRPKVYITVAGRSNALSGFTDGAVSAPVIACPPSPEAFGGADVYSSCGCRRDCASPCAGTGQRRTVGGENSRLVNAAVRGAVTGSQKRAAEKIMEDDQSLQ